MNALKRFLNQYGFYLFLTAAVLSLGALAFCLRSGLLRAESTQVESLSAMAEAGAQQTLLDPLNPDMCFSEPDAQSLLWLERLGLWIGHEGWDMTCGQGEPVYAMHDGEILTMCQDEALGNVLVLRGEEYETLYAGLDDSSDCRTGDQVQAGELLGYVGAPGRHEPEQSHLHLQLSRLP